MSAMIIPANDNTAAEIDAALLRESTKLRVACMRHGVQVGLARLAALASLDTAMTTAELADLANSLRLKAASQAMRGAGA